MLSLVRGLKNTLAHGTRQTPGISQNASDSGAGFEIENVAYMYGESPLI